MTLTGIFFRQRHKRVTFQFQIKEHIRKKVVLVKTDDGYKTVTDEEIDSSAYALVQRLIKIIDKVWEWDDDTK